MATADVGDELSVATGEFWGAEREHGRM
jgi:hypothetical protein